MIIESLVQGAKDLFGRQTNRNLVEVSSDLQVSGNEPEKPVELFIKALKLNETEIVRSAVQIGNEKIAVVEYKTPKGGLVPFHAVGFFIIVDRQLLSLLDENLKKYPFLIIKDTSLLRKEEYPDADIRYKDGWGDYLNGVLASMIASRKAFEGATFVDFGAGHSGIPAVAARQLGAQELVLIEGNYRAALQLRANLDHNHISADSSHIEIQDIQYWRDTRVNERKNIVFLMNLKNYGSNSINGRKELPSALSQVGHSLRLAIISGGPEDQAHEALGTLKDFSIEDVQKAVFTRNEEEGGYTTFIARPSTSNPATNMKILQNPAMAGDLEAYRKIEDLLRSKNIKHGLMTIEGVAGAGKTFLKNMIKSRGIAGFKSDDIEIIETDDYLASYFVSETEVARMGGFKMRVEHALKSHRLVVVAGAHVPYFFLKSSVSLPDVRVYLETDLRRARMRVIRRDWDLTHFLHTIGDVDDPRYSEIRGKRIDLRIANNEPAIPKVELKGHAPSSFKFVPAEIYGPLINEQAYDISSSSEWEALSVIIEQEARLAGLKDVIDIRDEKLSDIEKIMESAFIILGTLNYDKTIHLSSGKALVTIRKYSKGLEIIIERDSIVGQSIHHINARTSGSLELLLADKKFGVLHVQTFGEPYSGLVPDHGARYVLSMPAHIPYPLAVQVGKDRRNAAMLVKTAMPMSTDQAMYAEARARAIIGELVEKITADIKKLEMLMERNAIEQAQMREAIDQGRARNALESERLLGEKTETAGMNLESLRNMRFISGRLSAILEGDTPRYNDNFLKGMEPHIKIALESLWEIELKKEANSLLQGEVAFISVSKVLRKLTQGEPIDENERNEIGRYPQLQRLSNLLNAPEYLGIEKEKTPQERYEQNLQEVLSFIYQKYPSDWSDPAFGESSIESFLRENSALPKTVQYSEIFGDEANAKAVFLAAWLMFRFHLPRDDRFFQDLVDRIKFPGLDMASNFRDIAFEKIKVGARQVERPIFHYLTGNLRYPGFEKRILEQQKSLGEIRTHYILFMSQKVRSTIEQIANPAMVHRGGIDFNSNKMNLQVKNDTIGIKFHIDPAQLAQLQNASGFVPVVINIQPLNNLKQFLEVNE
jgi:hypothetical protein